jgi:glutathione S-transferase
VPALELDDGRILCETRAICSWLEGYAPEPNLMGEGYDERAFIEMADRRVELHLFYGAANCIRHTHPGWRRWSSRSFPTMAQCRESGCARRRAGWTRCWPRSLTWPGSVSRLPTSPPFARWSLRAG